MNDNESTDQPVFEANTNYFKFAPKYFQNSQYKLAFLALCIAWLPIVFLAAYENTLYSGTKLPFLHDIAMQARVLIAMPLLILLKPSVILKLNQVTKHFQSALLEDEDRETVRNTIKKCNKLSNSIVIELLFVTIVILSTLNLVNQGFFNALNNADTSWMTELHNNEKALSLAGKWTVFVSIPFIQLLVVRWFWRYLLWIFILYRYSRSKLKLLPSHADNAGGIGILMIAQKGFLFYFTTLGIIASGELISIIVEEPKYFYTVRNEVLGFVVVCLILLLSPLFMFNRKLIALKNNGLLKMSLLSKNLSSTFENEWTKTSQIQAVPVDKTTDPSLIIDYNSIFKSIQEIKPAPITTSDVLFMAGFLFVPFLPIVFIHFPVSELLQRLMGTLL